MNPKFTLTRTQVAEMAERNGFKMAPLDHPIYSEGLSITFSSRTKKPSQQKVIDSPYSDSPTDLDSATTNET